MIIPIVQTVKMYIIVRPLHPISVSLPLSVSVSVSLSLSLCLSLSLTHTQNDLGVSPSEEYDLLKKMCPEYETKLHLMLQLHF